MVMRNLVLRILFSLLFSCKGFNQHNVKKIINEMEIDFQDFFKEDIVSVRINDCSIIEDEVVTSNQIIGYTGFRIKVISPNKVSYRDKHKTLLCSFNLEANVKVFVTLNGNEELFEIDLSRGHYIGFDKKDEQLLLSQSKEPFEYD
jgi:hypothetical protein